MKRSRWFWTLGISFVLLSVAMYAIHFLIFKDSYFIGKYVIAQLGFLPINVFLVTIVLNSLLGNREKRQRMQKLNMVIGAFYSDIGTDLLKILSLFDTNLEQRDQSLGIKFDWSDEDFSSAKAQLRKLSVTTEATPEHLANLKEFLGSKRVHLLRLLENTNLLEHEAFSKLLWAIFHLVEELDHRNDLDQLSNTDAAHLSLDVKRAYLLLMVQWVDYMKHLSRHYPHLFSLAVRTNPFDPNASVEI